MSEEIVRQPLNLRETRRRRWDERLILRFPSLAYALTEAVLRRRPGSRLRRAMVRHAWKRALEAANRGDWEAAFALIPPDLETITPPELVGLGLEPIYRGQEGRLRLQLAWLEQLGDFRQDTKEIIDVGDCIIVLAHMTGRGLGSGAEFVGELAYVVTVSEGRLVREEPRRSHAEALEAAGLSE
jgi:ketosteroid isomerase-like protein